LAGLEPKEYQRRISTHALARAVVVRVHGSRGAVVGVGTAISVRDAGDGRG
jgi:transcription elongation GreA/GreB family factor